VRPPADYCGISVARVIPTKGIEPSYELDPEERRRDVVPVDRRRQ
jgi:hypothetical protein